MKQRKVKILLAAMTITAAITATSVPLYIYANSSPQNTIAVENELAKIETEGRSIYLGCETQLDIQSKILDKLGYVDKDIDMDSVKIEVTGEIVQKEDESDTYEISKDSIDDVLSISDDKVTFSRKGIFVGTVTVSDETKTVIFDVDEEVFSYVELNDWVTALENNNADFLSSSYVKFDSEKIKSVTVDD